MKKETKIKTVKIHRTVFNYDLGEVIYHKADSSFTVPLTVIMQQLKVMTNGVSTNWYLCRIGVGNVSDNFAEIELCRKTNPDGKV